MSVVRISQAKQAVNVPKADGDIDAVIVNIPSTGSSSANDNKKRQTINHGLNRVPVGCHIIWTNKVCNVIVISATENTIEVQFDAEQANVHLRIW
jgi:hypothetical protein